PLEMGPEQRTAAPWKDAHAKRLVKRLRRHRRHLFALLDQQGVPFDNHPAERAIRRAVIIGKNSHGNRSARGADCQAASMSLFRTLERRGHDPNGRRRRQQHRVSGFLTVRNNAVAVPCERPSPPWRPTLPAENSPHSPSRKALQVAEVLPAL
ncbi:MAG TPA: hypothetical protein EYP56_01710, partial [Planctomycetaceae bacterium]|nr:hypothetical protein [Planctomycetaceae bacterium]